MLHFYTLYEYKWPIAYEKNRRFHVDEERSEADILKGFASIPQMKFFFVSSG
jgi:hypothetical protein